MTSGNSILSPESTVTSLLASSPFPKNSVYSHRSDTKKYYDGQYESATDALQAYIANFQRSLHITDASKGTLQEKQKQPVTPDLLRTGFRKNVVKEKWTGRKLDYLNLLIDSYQTDSDCLSMTTDDLLTFPSDGSLPIDRASTFMTEHESYRLGRRCSQRSFRMPSRLERQTDDYPPCKKTLERRFIAKDEYIGPTHPLQSTRRKAIDTSNCHGYPRWLTSEKSRMNFSGVSSIPDLAYPVWLKCCDAHTDGSSGHSAVQGKLSRTLSSSSKVPSWLGELEAFSEEVHEDVRGLRRRDEPDGDYGSAVEARHPKSRKRTPEFTEQLSVTVGDATPSHYAPFSDDRIASLISTAEKTLQSTSFLLTSQDARSSSRPRTPDVLNAERSWDNPIVTFKSPVPVGNSDISINVKMPAGHLTTELLLDKEGEVSGYNNRKYPGPVEALKQMLFSLQAVEQRVKQRKWERERDAPRVQKAKSTLQEHRQKEHDIPADDSTTADRQSLQRALQHLGRLKHLLEDTGGVRKQRQDEHGSQKT